MDTVYIDGLKIDTVIGIYDWERKIKQRVIIDVEISCNITAAAKSDAIADACDYASISARITEFAESSQFQLIETLAEQTAQLVVSEFNVPEIKLWVSKPDAVKNAENVGIKITRKQ